MTDDVRIDALDRAVITLNRALETDPDAVSALVRMKVPCRGDLLDSGAAPVKTESTEGAEPEYSLIVMGLLDAVIGAGGRLAGILGPDDRISRFVLHP